MLCVTNDFGLGDTTIEADRTRLVGSVSRNSLSLYQENAQYGNKSSPSIIILGLSST